MPVWPAGWDNNRLGGVERVPSPSGQTLVYSSRARTLVDAIYDGSRFDSLPRAYGWIRQDIVAARITPDDLAKTSWFGGNWPCPAICPQT